MKVLETAEAKVGFMWTNAKREKKCDFRCRSSLVANCLITPELKARLVAQSADKRVESRADLKESGRSVFSSPVMQLDGSFVCALM